MNEKVQILATDALIAWEELEELAETIFTNLMTLELSSNNKVFSYNNDKIEANILGSCLQSEKK